ncbi:mRNA-capping enzyme [Armadillidium vulgare]|nr:mRNA-capping enzyme [Armadillidium vulgare]
MIVSYYVLKEDWSCDLALTTFAKARPPGIYKEDYIRELYARYDEPSEAPHAPELPDWHMEENSDDEDESSMAEESSNGNHGCRNGSKRKSKKMKKNPVFMEGVPGVYPLVEEPKLSIIQRKIQEICSWTQQGFPGCQPVSMTQDNLSFLSAKAYKVSWKADGTRYMMYIDGKCEAYFADRDYCIFFAPGIEFKDKHDLRRDLFETLLDGEMVIDVDPKTGTKYPRYLIYDAILIGGKNVATDNFHLRIERIFTDIISPRNAAIEKGIINKTKQPFSVRRKDFWDATAQNTGKLLSESFKKQLWHEPDGLIFQPVPETYITGRCDTVLKWKPPSHNSVDFKVKIVNTREEGCLPTTLAELYVGGLNTPFASIKATKALKELNGKIVECKLENNKWVMMRERTDKSFPNSYTTAVGVCTSIINPVTEELLVRFIETQGYKKPDQELMPPPPKRIKN